MNSFIKSPITSLNVFDVKTPKGRLTKVNARDFYSLTYRKQGTVKININGKTLVSTQNCVTLTPKNTDYVTEVTSDTHMIAVHFDCNHGDLPIEPFVYENANHQICRLFDEAYQNYSADDAGNYKCYCAFYKLLAEIEKLLVTKQNRGIVPAVVEAKKKIEASFQNPDFNIDYLVSKLSISASYLRREFKKAYGATPIEYLKYIRLQNAISLLSTDYYSVKELAEKCGYCSASYFIQSFKKSMGYSPTLYRKKHQ